MRGFPILAVEPTTSVNTIASVTCSPPAQPWKLFVLVSPLESYLA
jgi:hypothetical protein